MAKGCCGGSGTCACQIIGIGKVTVSGSGLPSDPFVIDSDVDFASSANKTFVTIIQGDGSSATPYSPVVSFADTAQLDDLPDVLERARAAERETLGRIDSVEPETPEGIELHAALARARNRIQVAQHA